MPRPQVMILGSYHMANPGKDYANLRADDVLAAGRQAEIAAVVDNLARFCPTHIAVETDALLQDTIDRTFSAYRRGDRELLPNEREQIGFRLARELGHPRVYAVDHPSSLDIGGLFAWGSANGFGALISSVQADIADYMALLQARLATATVAEILLELNSPAADKMHEHYLTMATIGAGQDQPGAAMCAAWYARNLHIFASVAQLPETATDRVLVVFGSGHGPLLRRFVGECPVLELVRASEYLTGPAGAN